MAPTTCSPTGDSLQPSEKPGQLQVLNAVKTTRKAAKLLEEAFRLMLEDDPIQPTITSVYAALCEAETQAAVLEDWYEGTRQNGSLSRQSCHFACLKDDTMKYLELIR